MTNIRVALDAVPEGMETTAEERRLWLNYDVWVSSGSDRPWGMSVSESARLLRDFDRALSAYATVPEGLDVNALADRFLTWPLPSSVCSDLCVTNRNYKFPRSGTNLLDANEARQMVEYLLEPVRDRLNLEREAVAKPQDDGRTRLSSRRTDLGRVVREAWRKWARRQPNPKPHWLLAFSDISPEEREVDCQIAEAVITDLTADDVPVLVAAAVAAENEACAEMIDEAAFRARKDFANTRAGELIRIAELIRARRIAPPSAEVTISVASEREQLRAAMLRAYLGLLVLRTMLSKTKLTAGRETTEELIADMTAAMPELPGLSALRKAPPSAGEIKP